MTRPLRVGGLTPLTTLDYPGELAAVLYCQGCPWRCRYCHNAGLLPATGAPTHDWGAVLAWLQRRRGLLDAVVFSGGEPTAQAALPEAVRAVRELGFKIGLHSAGIYPERLRALLPLLDWVGLDIKALPAAYPAITGVPGSGAPAWRSARLLARSGVAHQLRLTRHPSLTGDADLAAVRRELARIGAAPLVVQRCNGERCLDPTLAGTA